MTFAWISENSGPVEDRREGPKVSKENEQILDAYSRAVIDVVESISPAVISITNAKDQRPQGSGSGFVISTDGYAITNSHVVANRKRLDAITFDGDRIEAIVMGDDPATDIALVKLAASDLVVAPLGDSESSRVGQLVVAMGTPLGLHSTVSTGIVSAKGRSMRSTEGRMIENVVQHTAPINPGNSGGPLVDSSSRVIGINTAVIPMAQGLGFAVPSQTAKWVIDEFLEHGKVKRKQLGITGSSSRLSRRLMIELDLLSETVVEIHSIIEGSSAELSGLREGDLITELNGRVISSVDDIHRLLMVFQDVHHVNLTVVRQQRKLDVAVAV